MDIVVANGFVMERCTFFSREYHCCVLHNTRCKCEDYNPRNSKPIINADRIRSMSDEELAEFYGNDVDACPPGRDSGKCIDELYAHGEGPYPSVKQCMECWLDWLTQEAKE